MKPPRMRRMAVLGTCVLCTATGAAVGAQAASPGPARMLVYAQEWSLWPSRASLPPGRVLVQLWNRGQDAHDLRVRRLRNGRMKGAEQGVAVTQSGAVGSGTWHLGPGRYELYCSLPGHRMRGMRTTLLVR
jgi:hypothetical protein